MSFHENSSGQRWCACFQSFQPASESRHCEAGGCPELRAVWPAEAGSVE